MLETPSIAGTALLLVNAPAVPTNRVPMQIYIISFGIPGNGPRNITLTINIIYPIATSFMTFFFLSGIQPNTIEVSVYITVSIPKISPIYHSFKLLSYSRISRIDSLNVRHIRELHMHKAHTKI